MGKVLRVGVIGVGRIGRVHIESIQSIKDATVTMVRARACVHAWTHEGGEKGNPSHASKRMWRRPLPQFSPLPRT